MKQILILLFVSLSLNLSASSSDSCKTPDELLKAFYSCLDVAPGGKIDSARFVALFWPGTSLEGVATSRRDTTRIVNFSISLQEYLKGMEQLTSSHGFKEWETGRKELTYGHLRTIYSSYELADTSPDGKITSIKGVNIFQVFFDGNRWWITYCTYEEEEDAKKNLK